MNDTNIHIGHADDAINLINELLSDEKKQLPVRDYCYLLEHGLEALKDALERGII